MVSSACGVIRAFIIYIGERCPSCVIVYVRKVAIYRWLGIYISEREREREREKESESEREREKP